MSKGFDAGKAVEALEYDFTTCIVDGAPCAGKGTIPEFTDKQLREFGKRSAEAAERLGGKPGGKPEDLSDAINSGALDAAIDEMTNMVAEFCQQSPSAEELHQLPFRVRQAFYAWLFGELFDPKASPSGTKPSRAM